MVHSFTVYLLNKQGATGATLRNLTRKKMSNTADILAKADSLLKKPARGWVATVLTQIPTHCELIFSSRVFSMWVGRRTGAAYVLVRSEKLIYKSTK